MFTLVSEYVWTDALEFLEEVDMTFDKGPDPDVEEIHFLTEILRDCCSTAVSGENARYIETVLSEIAALVEQEYRRLAEANLTANNSVSEARLRFDALKDRFLTQARSDDLIITF